MEGSVRNIINKPTYKAFVSMDVASKNQVNPGIIKQFFHGLSHGFTFTLVSSISIIPRGVKQSNEPRGVGPINACQVILKPPVLVRLGVEVSVRTEHENVGPSNVEGVVKVGSGATFLERHRPASVEGGEAVRVRGWEGLDLVVAFGDHPWPPARVRLNQTTERVPKRLLCVGV